VRRRQERGILREDSLMQLLERPARVDAELVREDRLCPSERRERVRLPSRSVECEHPQRPRPLTQRILERQRLELADKRRILSQIELGGQAILHRQLPRFLESGYLALQRELVAQLTERGPSPEPERVPEVVPARGRIAMELLLPSQRQQLELPRIELARLDSDPVSAMRSIQSVCPDGRPEAVDVALERAPRRLGRLVAPDVIDQDVDRDDLVWATDEVSEHEPLLATPERDRFAAILYLDRAEDHEAHDGNRTPSIACGIGRAAEGSLRRRSGSSRRLECGLALWRAALRVHAPALLPAIGLWVVHDKFRDLSR
jgi:hypothetical protein